MILKIQSFIIKSAQTIQSIIKIVLLSRLSVVFDTVFKKYNEIIILGNGPSLQKDVNNFSDFFIDRDLICVNHFPTTNLYEKLKPSIYVTTAPDLWLDDIEEKFVLQSKKLFDTMNSKTTWSLYFFIPFEAKKYPRWQSQISRNNNIHIQYFNNISVEGWNLVKNFCFKRNLGMPRPHNVMIPSLMLSMAFGYKKIFLIGADHSWLPEISVTETNEVLINQKHFYDYETSQGQPLDKRGKGKRTLPELLYKFMTAFSSYFEIKRYADHREVKILNATQDSFIDAFERFNLKKNYHGR